MQNCKVPAESICEESHSITEKKLPLQVENMFDGSKVTSMTSKI